MESPPLCTAPCPLLPDALVKAPPDSEPRVPLPAVSPDQPALPECAPSPSPSSVPVASASACSPSWGMSLVVTLGSGISATAFGVHLVAYASPWLPSLDLSLLLRLDLGFLASAAPSSPSPVAAASAAGLLGSSIAAADVLGGRLPLLFVLCIATAFALLSFLASPAAGSSLVGLPLLAARNLVRHAQHLLYRGFAKGAPGQGSLSTASAVATLTKVLSLLLQSLRALLAPFLSSSLVALLLLPKKSSQKILSGVKPREVSLKCTTSGQADVPMECRQDGSGASESSTDVVQSEGNRRTESYLGCSSSGRSRALDRSVERIPGEGDLGTGQDSSQVQEERKEGELGPNLVSEGDLEELMSRLELREVDVTQGSWEMIVDKNSSSVDYCAWRRDPQDGGPTEYKSWTRFYGCTAQHLCAFYLDCEHCATYETMIRSYDNLGFTPSTGQETGRMVKKYPLCSPREYILGWRVWQLQGDGPTATYLCVTKAVEHPLAPKMQSVRRVEAYRCSWRIREVFVEGAGWCAEIDMYLQEDSGMQRSMAKLAFRRSIWGYIQGTDTQLRRYPAGGSAASAAKFPLSVQHAKQVPAWLRMKYLPHMQSVNEGSMPATNTSQDVCISTANNSLSGSISTTSGNPDALPTVDFAPQPWQSRVIRRSAPSPSETGAWSVVKRRALPVLAAAAGIGTMTIARGPVGLAAKVLVACAVRVLAAEHNVEARRQPLRLSRQRSRSKSTRQITKVMR